MQRLVSIFCLSVTRTWYLAIIARAAIYFAGFKGAQTGWDNHFSRWSEGKQRDSHHTTGLIILDLNRHRTAHIFDHFLSDGHCHVGTGKTNRYCMINIKYFYIIDFCWGGTSNWSAHVHFRVSLLKFIIWTVVDESSSMTRVRWQPDPFIPGWTPFLLFPASALAFNYLAHCDILVFPARNHQADSFIIVKLGI